MNRKLIILLVAILLPAATYAQQKASAFRFGVEWGAGSQFASRYHYNYVQDTGFRIDDKDSRLCAALLGNVMGFAGVDVSEQLGLAIYGGVAGISADRQMIPVLLRTSFYPSGCGSDGYFAFFDLGTDARSLISDSSILADIGAGRRLALSKDIRLDFLLTLRTLQQTPVITDPDYGTIIPAENIRVSYAGIYAIGLSISLEF